MQIYLFDNRIQYAADNKSDLTPMKNNLSPFNLLKK